MAILASAWGAPWCRHRDRGGEPHRAGGMQHGGVYV